MHSSISKKAREMAGICIGLVLFLTVFYAQAAMNRPLSADGQPTEIQAVGAVLDVDRINSAEQNFTLNIYMVFRWSDPSLAHDSAGSIVLGLSDVWNPRLTIINTQRYWENTRDEVEVSPEGRVTYRLHVFGDFSQPLDLKDFPMDQHVFEVPVVAAGYRPDEVVFKPDSRIDSFIAERLSVADWKVGTMRGNPREVTLAHDLKLPGFVFSFEAERRLHHYVIKAIIPLCLIVIMSWVVFWISPEHIPNQLSVAVTTVLTLIAYHIALSGRLPDIPYLTHMDKFLFSSTVLVFMALIEVVVTSHLSSTDQLALARKIDKTARWLFPVLFLSALGYSFFL
ncbi:MAG: hypothetical protein WBO16_00685 [Gammaproteobacteria bacterium]